MMLRDFDNPIALAELAQRLDGEPVPGLRMSETEFDEWCDEDVRAEWVDGEVILMSPASRLHVGINGFLWRLVAEVSEEDAAGETFGVEFQIRLPGQKSRRNPDVAFVSATRSKIIKPTYIDGPPDLIIEIVSPDSESRDWRDKYSAYEKGGVREYWIIDPQSKRVEAYTLGRDKKYRRLKEEDGRIRSKVLRKLFIKPAWLWESPLPKLANVIRQIRAGR